MPPRKTPTAGNDICDQLDSIADELDKMKPEGKPAKWANGLTTAAIRKHTATVRAQIADITSKSKDLTKVVDDKNANLKTLEAQRKQARAAVLGVFGDDSPEYAALGGVKRSDRKRPGRKVKA